MDQYDAFFDRAVCNAHLRGRTGSTFFDGRRLASPRDRSRERAKCECEVEVGPGMWVAVVVVVAAVAASIGMHEHRLHRSQVPFAEVVVVVVGGTAVCSTQSRRPPQSGTGFIWT